VTVFNCTRQTLIAVELEVARTGWSRIRGLLGRSADDFRLGKGLWIVPSEGIHTFGMSFPIDVAYIDPGYRVIALYHSLAPLRIAAVKFGTRSVLELPAGALVRSQTQVGDLLHFIVSKREGE
jgi:uncharacterized protein